MSARQKALYGKSPKMERDEDGKMGVKTPDAGENEEAGTEGAMHSGADHMTIAHAMERHAMHGRHEHEHMMADAKGDKDKKAMHAKHETEMHDMHARHEKELKAGTATQHTAEDKSKTKEAKSESEGKEYKEGK